LLLYVDHVLIVNNSKHEIEKVKAEVNGNFDIKILMIEVIK